MASIGKLAISAASLTQENTVALANINFDFALVKYTAPPEFHDLGSCLSKQRQIDAEDGKLHRVARNLGALFVDDVPDTPHLFQAYAERVSEILKNPNFNPQGNEKDGPLIDFIGADGTSIWAAATSGTKAALAVHLLACMLARAWSGSEAVSIWSELVTGKTAVLMDEIQGESFKLSTMTASQIKFSRDELAGWDASARSWLLTGDEAKTRQQTQLLLIIDNMQFPIQNGANTYVTVMKTWKEAMTVMNNLVSGMPQSLQSGAPLLGLASWHLYPDISVQEPQVVEVRQEDPLIPAGGIVTLGLHWKNSERGGGVRWSLPLAHLKFYGRPEESTRIVDSKSSRVTFAQIIQVALGSMTRQWGPYFENPLNTAKALIAIKEFLNGRDDAKPADSSKLPENTDSTQFELHSCDVTEMPVAPIKTPWLEFLCENARVFQSNRDDSDARRLYSMGQRSCTKFLAEEKQSPPPLFGLTNPTVLIGLISSTEARIEALRKISHLFTNDPNEMVIRYRNPNHGRQYMNNSLEFEFATLLPQQSPLKSDGKRIHRRWVLSPKEILSNFVVKRSVEVIETLGEACGVLHGHTFSPLSLPQTQQQGSAYPGNASDLYWGARNSTVNYNVLQAAPDPNMLLNFVWDSSIPAFGMDTLRTCLKRHCSFSPMNLLAIETGWQLGSLHHFPDERCHYQFIFGDVTSAAIYRRNTFRAEPQLQPIGTRPTSGARSAQTVPQYPSSFPAESVVALLSGKKLDREQLCQYLESLDEVIAQNSSLYRYGIGSEIPRKKSSQFIYSIRAFQIISTLYEGMPNAKIDLGVTTRPLVKTLWAQEVNLKNSLFRTNAFSAISYFESGFMDINPIDFADVFAVSSGNSLFVLDHLLRDPYDQSHRRFIRRVIGNVGRPGLSLIISPDNPDVKEPALDEWSLVNHQEFNGKLEGNFAYTSLHLQLTGYESPIITTSHGSRGQDAAYVEAVISAYDHGEWVADVNMLQIVPLELCRNHNVSSDVSPEKARNSLRLWLGPVNCSHKHPEDWKKAVLLGGAENNDGHLISIDNWSEFLDPPRHAGIARATGCWLARAALTAVAFQKKFVVILLPELDAADNSGQACWHYVSSVIQVTKSVDPHAKIVIIS